MINNQILLFLGGGGILYSQTAPPNLLCWQFSQFSNSTEKTNKKTFFCLCSCVHLKQWNPHFSFNFHFKFCWRWHLTQSQKYQSSNWCLLANVLKSLLLKSKMLYYVTLGLAIPSCKKRKKINKKKLQWYLELWVPQEFSELQTVTQLIVFFFLFFCFCFVCWEL